MLINPKVYTCALEREVLWQGKIYLTANHASFYGKMFGKVVLVSIPFTRTLSIKKKATVGVFNNAIKFVTVDKTVK